MHDHDSGASGRRDASVTSTIRRESGLALVQVRGIVDEAAAGDLGDRLRAAAHGPRPRVVVDLAGVTSLSPAGLDVLLHAQESLDRAGGVLELLEPSPAVVLLLQSALEADGDQPNPSSRRGVSHRIRIRSDGSGSSSSTSPSNGP